MNYEKVLKHLAEACAELQVSYKAQPSDELRRSFNTLWENAMEYTAHIEFFIMVCNEVNRLEKNS